MPLHPDFVKILRNMQKKYGKERGRRIYYSWLNKHGYDDTKAFPRKKKVKKKKH